MILYNALVYTVDAAHPKATAVAIRDGRILAVGGDRQVLALAGKKYATGRSRAPAPSAGLQRCACASLDRWLGSAEKGCLRQDLDRRDSSRAPPAGRSDPARPVGAGIPVRRWQDGAAADPRRSRRRSARPSGHRDASRRAYGLREFAGVDGGGCHPNHARSSWGPIRAWCRRATERPSSRQSHGRGTRKNSERADSRRS